MPWHRYFRSGARLKDEAKAIIGYLGTTDFYPAALKEDRAKGIFKDSDAKEPQLVLRVASEAHQGTDRESVWLAMPIGAEAGVRHIEALKPLLGKESTELLNQVVRDFQAPPGN